MGMFDNYYNIDESYHPDNMHFKIPVEKVCTSYDTVTKEYDVQGHFVGYKWDYGNSVRLIFNVNKTILVRDDSIIYDNSGEYPTEETVGIVGQRCYNVVDIRSWECTEILEEDGVVKYVWNMDDDVVTFTDGSLPVQLTPDMSNRAVTVVFRDWKNDIVYQNSLEDSHILAFILNSEQSKDFVTGTYTCTVSITSDIECIDLEKINFRVV